MTTEPTQPQAALPPETDPKKQLGQALKAWRKRHGMTQSQACARLEARRIKVPLDTYRKWEQAFQAPSGAMWDIIWRFIT